jgi:hypothetical protein
MIKYRFYIVIAVCFLAAPSSASATTIFSSSKNLSVMVETAGNYQVSAQEPGWQLGGRLPSPAHGIAVEKATDAVGDYQQISFAFTDATRPMIGRIRLYADKDLVLFSQTSPQASISPPSAFPNFTTLPADHFLFSYDDNVFSPPHFGYEKTSTPCLLFDRQDHALVISPASHFVVASMVGDGRKQIGSGFNSKLMDIPAGFTQQTLMALGQGINHTWDIWGRALTDLQGKKRPANDADIILKYYGYWTDNGAAYWYNYDKSKGYQGTLQALVDSYRAEQIPIHYLQLDSWWYHKTMTQPDGKQGGPKNSHLPEGDWNRYGGTIEYKAHPFIFPDGLEAFHEKTGLPFITHNRWIDPASPYHNRYKFSGIAAIDPGFWDEIMTYLKTNGVVGYEQDWLNEILKHSPQLSSTVSLGDAFFDGMANASKACGLSVQYCMPTPLCILQGSKYDNLTTIRISDDRFKFDRYHNFLYTSRFAYSLGIWPWTDVYNSTETTNILLGTLSAGPVGTGDAIGKEDKSNILLAARADGVIVKPDAPLIPTDMAYLAEAEKLDVPLVATTYTDHHGLRTIYGVALNLSKTAVDAFSIKPSDLGCTGPVYVYNYFAGTGQKLDPGATMTVALQGKDCAYLVAAPIGATGIAFLGDANKFVGTGKKRISSLREKGRELTSEVILAANEQEVKLRGYALSLPDISVQAGRMGAVEYNALTGIFTLIVKPDPTAPLQTIDGDSIRKLTVTFKPKQI